MSSTHFNNDDVKSLPFYTLLDKGLLIVAFDRLKRYCEKKMLYELSDELSSLQQSYFYMIKYALTGVEDKGRDRIKSDIVSRLADIYEMIRRRSSMNRAANIYVSTARSVSERQLGAVVDEYLTQLSRLNDFVNIVGGEGRTRLKHSVEGMERMIFNIVWTQYPLTAAHIEVIKRLMTHEGCPRRLRQMIVSALMLGNMSYWDDERFMLLSESYERDLSPEVALLAMTGIVLSLDAHRRRPLSRRVAQRLASLRELPTWHSDLRTITLELVRTHDTKRITENMSDFFSNSFSQVSDEVKRSIKDLSNIEDLTDLEDNPEWMEMLDRTGIADKMRELTDLQEEGGDIFMQPFRHLKGDQFFYEIANWFMPFDTSHTAVESVDPEGLLSEMVAGAPMLCDSDKYSFILAMKAVPEQQRRLMMSQLEAGNMQAQADVVTSMDTSADHRRRIVNGLVQSLYRFFNLNRYKGDFASPFNEAINPTTLPALSPDYDDVTLLEMIAEFYFKHKYYSLALATLLTLEQHSLPTAEMYQRIAYCYQRTGEIAQAVKYYEQAELLNSRSAWTLKRLAQCYMLLSRPSDALPYYERLLTDYPDSLPLIVSMARCKMALDDYQGALPLLYQAVYLKSEDVKYKSLLAWALLASGEIDKARIMLNEIAEGEPSRGDRINIGHVALIDHDVERALNYYGSVMGDDKEFDATIGSIAVDFDVLCRYYSVDDNMRDMLVEALTARYLSNKQ